MHPDRHTHRSSRYGQTGRNALMLIIACSFWLPAFAAAQDLSEIAPGEILEVEFLTSYTPDEIREENSALFADAGLPQAEYTVDHYMVYFRSTDFDGSPARIRSQMFVPHFSDPTERPVFVFAAGTTGVSEKCAPIIEIPELNRWGSYRANMLAYGGAGIITIFPEYLGFGDPLTSQRYFNKVVEAHVLLDAARAVYAFFRNHGDTEGSNSLVAPSEALFLGGYSQGGHAAHAAADLQPVYAPEISITGLIGFGQTNDIAMLMREMPYYSPYIIFSLSEVYGPDIINPADYLQPEWMGTFDADIQGLCVEEFQYHYPRDGSRLFTPDFYDALHYDLEGYRMSRKFPEMARVLRENRAGFTGHGIPSLVIHGEKDIIVSISAQERFVQALRRGGSEVQFEILPGARHRDVRPFGFQLSVDWMEQANVLPMSENQAE